VEGERGTEMIDKLTNKIIKADCLKLIKKLPDYSVGVTITDPPYHLGSEYDIDSEGHYIFKGSGVDFMQKWGVQDGRWWNTWFKEMFRVTKYGGYVILFNIDRQSDLWTYYARRNGWEVCQKLYWLFFNGFPKAVDAGRMIDKKLGFERESLGKLHSYRDSLSKGFKGTDTFKINLESAYNITLPESDLAKLFHGYKYSIAPLKPMFEEILVFRRPSKSGSILEDLIESQSDDSIHPSVVNIDGTRVDAGDWGYRAGYKAPSKKRRTGSACYGGGKGIPDDVLRIANPSGRHTPQVIISEEMASKFDDRTGDLADGHWTKDKIKGYGEKFGGSATYHGIGEKDGSGGGGSKMVARIPFERADQDLYFYTPKASVRERESGLEALVNEEGVANIHPTVKPLRLMEWLITLFTMPKQTVFDPFIGSGSTAIACVRLRRKFIACELEPKFIEIAKARIKYWGKRRSGKL
jgi:site-specific DNA-methyltransferase (adenine-specific)